MTVWKLLKDWFVDVGLCFGLGAAFFILCTAGGLGLWVLAKVLGMWVFSLGIGVLGTTFLILNIG